MKIRNLLGAGLIALFTGCGTLTIGQVGKEAVAPGPDETYFVVGVKPEKVVVGFDRRGFKNGVLHQRYSGIVFQGTPEDGYIMGKSKAGDLLVFGGAILTKPDGSEVRAVSCGGARTMVFPTPAGKVIYVGDVNLSVVDGKLSFSTGFDPAGAAAFVNAKYPGLKDKLVFQRHKMLKDITSCIR